MNIEDTLFSKSMPIKLLLICFSQIKVKKHSNNPPGKHLNVTIPLFGQLVAQSSQRNNNSEQQFVLTNFVDTPITPNFEQVVKRLFTSI